MKSDRLLNCNERNLVADNMFGDNIKRKSDHQRDNLSMSDRMHLFVANTGEPKKNCAKKFSSERYVGKELR